MTNQQSNHQKTDLDQFYKSRKARNYVMAAALFAFIIILFFVTIFKLGASLFI